jgi:hypothetical protein
MKTSNKCYGCSFDLINVISFDEQPISNRYLSEKESSEDTYPLILGQCSSCKLTQLINPALSEQITPKIPGISYNEPESHLDDFVEIITKLPGINNDSCFLGLSYKEDSTIKRLNKVGFFNTYRLDPVTDLEIKNPYAGIELIQHQISNFRAAKLPKGKKADILFARHIIEHAVDIKSFVSGLLSICNPNAYVIFEVPDCTKIFNNSDYAYVWEEHIAYFTEITFINTLQTFGLEVVELVRYPYQIEDSLIAITRRSKTNLDTKRTDSANLFFKYTLDQMRHKYAQALEPFKGSTILFGAGHLSVKLINLLQLKDFFEAVIDDDPVKNGKFMPGSHLPIVSSEILYQHKYNLCLLTLSPESSGKVKTKFSDFERQNGIFLSAFSSDSDSILSYNVKTVS